MKHYFFLSFFLLWAISIFSQNVVIDYESWEPPSPLPCRLFQTSTLVTATGALNGEIAHLTSRGQPQYDVTNKAVSIMTSFYATGAITKGAKYSIKYNFKPEHTYFAYVTAALTADIRNNNTGPWLGLNANNNFTVGSTECNGAEDVDGSSSTNPNAVNLKKKDFYEYQFALGKPGSKTVLELTAFLATAEGAANVLIRKIRIEEIPPTPVFTLEPASVIIPCSNLTSQTFTVTNVYNSPGTIEYEWHLGSINNGWEYNGSPAPSYISTTTNSITLTPSSSVITLSNVAVTIKLNGNNYSELNAIATLQPPPISISGPNSFCSTSEQYNVVGLPSGSEVLWSVSPSNKATLSCTTCPTVTLNKLNEGIITLTATVSNTCGGTLTTTKTNIFVGACATVVTKNDSPVETGNSVPGYAKFIHPEYGVVFEGAFGGPQNSSNGIIFPGIYTIEVGFIPGGGDILVNKNGTQSILTMNGHTTTYNNVPVNNSYYIYAYNPFHYNSLQSNTFSRNNCPSGQAGSSVVYSVSEGTYYGSTQAEANSKAIDQINNFGQSYANSSGTCTAVDGVTITNNTGSTKIVHFKQGTTTIQTVGIGANTTLTPSIPAGTYTVQMLIPGPGTARWTLNSSSQVGNSATFTNINVGTYPVSIQINNSSSLRSSLYPNPADNTITITAKDDLIPVSLSSQKEKPVSKSILIKDLTGITKKKLQYLKKDKEIKIDISDLKTGLYIIEINDGTEVEYHRILVN